ncbi:hypothetical protein Acr_08g0000610 [Actinidia rufa]|uniref:Uncharacterized protein n=1 Tax=Actinidia rufa TaxID=165716 RepID=A0A7J0EYZ4_9ERIC|nr:hypothetical protein Acr_08g0000610 [Actinidia rufa]
MDPIHIDDEIDSEFQQFLESQVDTILHDFEEFENETLPIVVGSSNPVFKNDKDASGFHKSPNTMLLNFQRILVNLNGQCAPYEMYPTNAQNLVGDNQDNYMIIQDWRDDKGQFTIEATGDSTENVNVTSCTSPGSIGGDCNSGGSGVADPFLNYSNVTVEWRDLS